MRRLAGRMRSLRHKQRTRGLTRRPEQFALAGRRRSVGGGGSASAVLAKTTDVPVGGGKILTVQKIVITQPTAGAFHAFTAICTHQGCIVDQVASGTIDCPCHGSKYRDVNGSVVNGPATLPLAAVQITVQGTSIIQA
ncbi:MAG: ubiquinol-cytochrome c reductase iron-sulfur subunit [Streptosporangiaceae bacterium]